MLAFMLVALLAVPPAAAPAYTLTPRIVGEIDLGQMKGSRLRRLAWSPDGSELYLQTYDPDVKAQPKDVYHFIVSTTDATARQVDAEPAWAAEYWLWKAAQMAPGDPEFKIEVVTEKGIAAATALPMGGDMAKGGVDTSGGSGASMDAMLEAARQSQNTMTYRMRLHGQTVGEWINHPIMPGLTFGWGPKGSDVIAYADAKGGQLIIMDKDGKRQKIEGTRDVALPSWTADGTRMAYLESRGRTKYAVVIAAVAHK